MDETVLMPSPNWFLTTNLAVSKDGWLIYGGPSKSLCVLKPQNENEGVISGSQQYQAYVVIRAHLEKIVSVDLSPEWLENRTFITGSADGCVKQWVLKTINNKIKMKTMYSHEVHKHEKEEIVGVGYSNETTAITVGCFNNVVKWDLASNVAKTYPHFMKNFKPTCMACSLHVPLNIAVGTKQGVIFVLDLNGNGKIVYKVRGHDDEVMNVSWCPQYETIVKKKLSVSENRSLLSSRLDAIRNQAEKETNVLEQSGIVKSLPEDSFDESIVQEDDMFDIYKDHEPDEFGHKKYEPEDILVKVKQETTDDKDYLAECLKLKEDILKRKNQAEPSIESLVEALDKTHVESPEAQAQSSQINTESPESEATTCKTKGSKQIECSSHIHKHLLTTVGKVGGIRVWSKSGKLVGSCALAYSPKNTGKKVTNSPTVLWYKPDKLLIADGKSQMVECNPLKIDAKNKLEWRVVHTLHKRGMFCIASNAPRVVSKDDTEDWPVWSASQDRNIIQYSLKDKKVLAVHATCGGYVYSVQPCPYDAGKVALSVGDGAVRVWEFSTLIDDDSKLTAGEVSSYWQNVQGKVLTLAWHPTKEHLLAFGTAEARVGLIDTSGKTEKPARVLQTALNHGVYSMSWGEGMQLFACGGGSLVKYRADHPDLAPEPVDIRLEGDKWEISAVNCTPRGILCGSFAGAIAVLTINPPHTVTTSVFIFTKMIHSVEWHPQQTSSSSEESPYKNLIAASALDKESNIIIVNHTINEDGTVQLKTWKELTGHKLPVLQLAWNPHREELLLSSSQDTTVRVWDIVAGVCISIFGGHSQSSLGVSWVAMPQLPHYVMSGGGDACLRIWDINKNKAEDYDGETKHEVTSKKNQKAKSFDTKERKSKEETVPPRTRKISIEGQEQVATTLEITTKAPKAPKRFLLPLITRQLNDNGRVVAPRTMLKKFLEKSDNATEGNIERHDVGKTDTAGQGKVNSNIVIAGRDIVPKEKGDVNSKAVERGEGDTVVDEKEDGNTIVTEKGDGNVGENEHSYGCDNNEPEVDFLKIFGSIKEINEYLDYEMASHLGLGHYEAWIMLSIFRGNIDTMIQFASQRNMLCPYLLSIAPCVSFKYWKDVTQLYLAQIDRLVAKGQEEMLYENRHYGGAIYRKAATLMSIHDLKGAVTVLTEARLFKEAYVLCRLRYMDSLATEILELWARDFSLSGNLPMSSVCYIVLGNLSQAAQVLSRSQDQECLSLAADIAKVAGRTSFADHVGKKALIKYQEKSEKTEELLKQLPSKMELLLKEHGDKDQNSDKHSDTLVDEASNSASLNDDTQSKD